MRSNLARVFGWAAAVGGLCVSGFFSGPVVAQPLPVVVNRPWRWPSWGATPLSSVIHAQADYLESAGYFLESAAIARRHRALAAKQEMENALQWVDTYFEMRERNRAWRLKENPDHLTKLGKSRKAMDDQITNFLQNSLKNDLTGKLNWLLAELSGPSLAYQYQAGDKTLADTNVDEKLSPSDIHHVRLTDGGHEGGGKLIFRADEAKVLQTEWPLALRGPQFQDVRVNFEAVRDNALKDLKAGNQLGWDQEQSLINAVDQLTVRFNEVYNREARLQMQLEQPGTYSDYKAGQRFLQSLAAGVFRALRTNDHSVFDGSYKFTGDSVVDLLLHMYQNGLEFAPPQPGDETTYKRIFMSMRELYLSLAPERAMAQTGNP